MKRLALGLFACAVAACGAPHLRDEPPAPPAAVRPAAPPAPSILLVPDEPVAPSLPAAPAAPAAPAEPPPSLHVDCSSPGSGNEGASLRGWQLGGPAGASFNWQGNPLACTVEMHVRCEGNPGKGRVRLSAGSRLVADRRVAISGEKTPPLIIEIPAKVWDAALERDGNFIYERLQVVARLDVMCLDGEFAVSTIHLVDGFVGGFGGGE